MSDKYPYALGFEIINAKEKPSQMRGIFVPDGLPVPRVLKRLDFKWLWDREPLFESAKNKEEMRKRIAWLSEGSLRHHLSQFKSDMPHGGCPDEKTLYAAFLVARGHYPY